MSDRSAAAEIVEGGRVGGAISRPSRTTLECVVQHTAQPEPVCTGDCTTHCTGDCTTRRITLVGGRDGAGPTPSVRHLP